MKEYNHKKVEAKWKKAWEKAGIYKTKKPAFAPASPRLRRASKASAGQRKYYVLDMFPYPSGAGLHVGHPKGYIATDVVARMKMMQGYNVLHPMGWDAFGLPAENYAIKNKVHPSVAVKKNIATFKRQLGLLGFTYDWDREINTTDPEYYRWTQWIFLEMFKKGLAYESYEPINWCPGCQTGLANEDLEDGKCERCGSAIERKPMRQWVLRITDYAEKLLSGLDKLKDWPEPIKEMQRNWIGRSEGAIVKFKVSRASGIPFAGQSSKFKGDSPLGRGRGGLASPSSQEGVGGVAEVLEVFTTRPDTLFGATYCVVAPEHGIISKIKNQISNIGEVEKYINGAKKKSDLERTDLAKEKTGVEIKGIKAVNPVNGEELPIFVADYVLTGYGTGAIMAVPAHDERDFEFAKKYGLPIKTVVASRIISKEDPIKPGLPIVPRDAIACIIKNPIDNKFLCLQWKVLTKWRTLVTGGIEGKEDVVEAAKREIAEETGYKNLKFVRQLPWEVYDNFYHLQKRENRCARFRCLVFELIGEDKTEIGETELAKHEPVWVEQEKMESFLTAEAFKYFWSVYSREKAFVGDGININSEFLDGLETSEAKAKMISWLEEKKLGQKKIQYKLRDWVFSRQRYWGEPIPLVKCERCANKKQKVLIIHGLTGQADKNWMPWMKNKLEGAGFEVFIPTMMTTEHPVFEEWMKELSPIVEQFDEDDVIVGHSLGGNAVLYLLERLNKKIGSIFLVAPAVGKLSDEEWAQKKIKRPDKDYDSARVFEEKEINFRKIINKVDSATIIYSDDDESVQPCGREFWPSNWAIKHVGNYGHFKDKEYPVLFDIIRASKSSGWVPVPEKDLPVELPKVKSYAPTGTGESPLADIAKWVNTKCPKCGGKALRETNTMPQWAGSCWYYLAFSMLGNKKSKIKNQKYDWNREGIDYWNPVDLYVGGAEHATRHLIYARFWHKFLFDIGAVKNDEPFTRLQNVGLILAEDGRKMSKRWNNVINPDDVVKEYGADAMRLYEMFMGPFDQPCAWNTQGLVGMRRFLEKIWVLKEKVISENKSKNFKFQISNSKSNPNVQNPKSKIDTLLHQTIKKVTEDIEAMRYNTAISQMMILVNEISREEKISDIGYQILIKLLSPFAPHIAEEIWSASWRIGNKKSIFAEPWPVFDEALSKESEITLAVQVNGKLRDTILVLADITEEEAKKLVLRSEKVQKWLEGKEPRKIIYVKGKLVSIVI